MYDRQPRTSVVRTRVHKNKLITSRVKGYFWPAPWRLRLTSLPLLIADCQILIWLLSRMINAVLVFNNSGQARLTKFYTQLVWCLNQARSWLLFPCSVHTFCIMFWKHISWYGLTIRTPKLNNLSLPRSTTLSPNVHRQRATSSLSQGASQNNSTSPSDAPTQITYRTYATLSFILISTSTESPLALIDLIQVFVEALDRLFENVCELDLIFGYETMHAVLGEMIVGGVVVETNLDRIVQGVRSQEGSKGKRKAIEAGSTSIGRSGIPGLGVPWRWRPQKATLHTVFRIANLTKQPPA